MSSSQPLEHETSQLLCTNEVLSVSVLFQCVISVRTGDPDVIQLCRLLRLLAAERLDG